MKKMIKTPLAAAMGTAVVSTFTATAVNAEANPFEMTELSSGYMQLAQADKAGEMSCGAGMGKKEGSCGEGKCGGSVKMDEGKCAGNKPMPAKAQAKGKEAACGEGKCGAMMNGGKMKKGMESSCGAMMKGKEGACGEKVDVDKASGKAKKWGNK